ncbi:MAG: DnaJ domain-containing protein [Caldilineaceae bacterium]|nr:DnaJ domain-containing protein [Caldilineaceae bacterium]
MDYKDYYQILGVSKNADEAEIKKVYRKLARQFHPDVNPGDKNAEQRFKEISEAYTVLSDPEKRKKYDRFGAQWQQYDRAGVNPDDIGGFGGNGSTRTVTPEEFEQMFGGFGRGNNSGFSDFFEGLFGGGAAPGTRQRNTGGTPFEGFNPRTRRGQDVETPVKVTLEEAYYGTTRMLQRDNGQRLEVNIPAGVRTGSRVRVSGEGGPGMGAAAGDLYLMVEVKPHPRFARDDNDLTVKVDVDLYTAVLGGEVQVPTMDRPVVLTIPAGTQNGKRFRLRKLGMPNLKSPEQRGDLYAEINVNLPETLSREERQLFERLRDLRSA